MDEQTAFAHEEYRLRRERRRMGANRALSWVVLMAVAALTSVSAVGLMVSGIPPPVVVIPVAAMMAMTGVFVVARRRNRDTRWGLMIGVAIVAAVVYAVELAPYVTGRHP